MWSLELYKPTRWSFRLSQIRPQIAPREKREMLCDAAVSEFLFGFHFDACVILKQRKSSIELSRELKPCLAADFDKRETGNFGNPTYCVAWMVQISTLRVCTLLHGEHLGLKEVQKHMPVKIHNVRFHLSTLEIMAGQTHHMSPFVGLFV